MDQLFVTLSVVEIRTFLGSPLSNPRPVLLALLGLLGFPLLCGRLRSHVADGWLSLRRLFGGGCLLSCHGGSLLRDRSVFRDEVLVRDRSLLRDVLFLCRRSTRSFRLINTCGGMWVIVACLRLCGRLFGCKALVYCHARLLVCS
jgi:hypothetical protein